MRLKTKPVGRYQTYPFHDHDTVKANELFMLIGNLEKPEYTELRGKA